MERNLNLCQQVVVARRNPLVQAVFDGKHRDLQYSLGPDVDNQNKMDNAAANMWYYDALWMNRAIQVKPADSENRGDVIMMKSMFLVSPSKQFFVPQQSVSSATSAIVNGRSC